MDGIEGRGDGIPVYGDMGAERFEVGVVVEVGEIGTNFGVSSKWCGLKRGHHMTPEFRFADGG